jgi:hypothetical protein
MPQHGRMTAGGIHDAMQNYVEGRMRVSLLRLFPNANNIEDLMQTQIMRMIPKVNTPIQVSEMIHFQHNAKARTVGIIRR